MSTSQSREFEVEFTSAAGEHTINIRDIRIPLGKGGYLSITTDIEDELVVAHHTREGGLAKDGAFGLVAFDRNTGAVRSEVIFDKEGHRKEVNRDADAHSLRQHMKAFLRHLCS